MITIRVPLDPYAYIEYQIEGTVEDAVAEYKRAIEAYKANGEGFGLETKDFNSALDKYLKDGTGETEVYMQMNDKQKYVFQEIKKSLKRIK